MRGRSQGTPAYQMHESRASVVQVLAAGGAITALLVLPAPPLLALPLLPSAVAIVL